MNVGQSTSRIFRQFANTSQQHKHVITHDVGPTCVPIAEAKGLWRIILLIKQYSRCNVSVSTHTRVPHDGG